MDPTPALPGASTETAESFLWKAEGHPFAVALSFDVIDRMTPEITEAFRALKRRGAEVGGLLLGRVTPGNPAVIRILDYVPVACERRFGPSYVLSDTDYERFDREAAKWRGRTGGLTLVGYYRSNTREAIRITPEDQALLDSRFPEPEAVVLLVKPAADRPFEATFVSRTPGGGPFPETPTGPVFTFRRRDLGGGVSPDFTPQPGLPDIPEPPSARNRMLANQLDHPAPAVAPALAQPIPAPPPIQPAPTAVTPAAAPPVLPLHPVEPAPLASLYPPEPPVRQGLSTGAALLLSLLCAVAGAAVGYFAAVNQNAIPGLSSVTGVASASGQEAHRLHLKSEVQTDLVVFSWDASAPALRDATKAIATIEDGDNLKTIEIDAAALKAGALSYDPANKALTFRLDVLTSEKSGVTETLTVSLP